MLLSCIISTRSYYCTALGNYLHFMNNIECSSIKWRLCSPCGACLYCPPIRPGTGQCSVRRVPFPVSPTRLLPLQTSISSPKLSCVFWLAINWNSHDSLLGFENLLELFTELGKTVYLLDYPFILKGCNSNSQVAEMYRARLGGRVMVLPRPPSASCAPLPAPPCGHQPESFQTP